MVFFSFHCGEGSAGALPDNYFFDAMRLLYRIRGRAVLSFLMQHALDDEARAALGFAVDLADVFADHAEA